MKRVQLADQAAIHYVHADVGVVPLVRGNVCLPELASSRICNRLLINHISLCSRRLDRDDCGEMAPAMERQCNAYSSLHRQPYTVRADP